MRHIFAFGMILFSGFVVVGCAHKPVSPFEGRDPKILLENACQPGRDNAKGVEGTVWMKASSKEATGQFPATVLARVPASLNLEVQNLLGGTEAVIRIDGQHYQVEVPNKPQHTQKGSYSWGGIPLEWATELFLGRIPCPPADSWKNLKLSVQDDRLVAEVPASLTHDQQTFTYTFIQWNKRPWPESLHWERKTATVFVDFKFGNPDNATGSPQKWEARSPHGEVKVRWKEREMLR